ncbi:hypothetical protein UFOVP938_43 [uncultured Caudovirales phage]|uniref:Uncharacterized protein n=3 Tax=uncultured Caudovirales phage TaxID=2100421 RepID=A0A6J7XET4_9CAUD|nr:hypothetical protein UFOVP938_43 [uncultured Caudovirales phage]CAB4183666.1 hypothetical protein UFOVP1104_58 [uncultured Caudovirales phage]CAB4202365.1 hypothetical protein UFOVP1371_10 [uncultured Caudovirales phage]CAB4214757.1 hypothetical protein UFOVP1468_18 [uncultured Caudovirales phage]CAB5229337.1 hypothetical protein UFOVP1555_29 [uncultured Caudovirales phage]
MICLLDTSHDLEVCRVEIGGGDVGQLLTPLTRYRLRNPELPWAIDNGAFSRFEEKAFLALLEREKHHQKNCKFVSCPDVVGSARRTLEVFQVWRPKLEGWNVALVAQDGQEDLPIPWDQIEAIFVGGSTSFKCGTGAEQIIKTAQIFKKWVHVGRVNDPDRFEYFENMGVDSIDGTGLARYTHMRQSIANRKNQLRMFDEMPI